MPLPDSSIAWWMTLAAVGVIAVAAFLVSYTLTDVLHLPRAAYLAALMAVSGMLTYGYLAWSGTDMVEFLTANWAWGVLGALLSGVVTARGITVAGERAGLAAAAGPRGTRLAEALAWEGLLYGAAEGLLLSALPVLAAWQSFDTLGWTGAAAGKVGSGALALAVSALVIWVHHLGYAEFRRGREVILPIVGCGLLSVAYLLARSPIAPVGGHFLMHSGAQVRGIRLPPYSRAPQAPDEAPTPAMFASMRPPGGMGPGAVDGQRAHRAPRR